MIYAADPKQMILFDATESLFSPMIVKRLQTGWAGVFRTQLLHLMPAGKLAKHFHPYIGQPTKELYGMAGVLLLKEFFNFTIERTVEQYLMNIEWQYALNVNPATAGMSHATIERYTKLFIEDDLAADIFHKVTSALIEALELDVSRQRLDATHIFSDMATFGRTRLMGVTIKRFLRQLKRHHRNEFDALDESLLLRYAPCESRLFAAGTDQCPTRQAVAEDMLFLVQCFSGEKSITNKDSYKHLCRVLEEQCDVEEQSVIVKKRTGGNVIHNTSDCDVTYDGHKGPGYQAQIAETCSRENKVNLITNVTVEPAHTPDGAVVQEMTETLVRQQRKPEVLYADEAYGSDGHVQVAAEHGVDLQAPVAGGREKNNDPQRLTLDDFVIDEQTNCVERCPNGHVPISSEYDTEKDLTKTIFPADACGPCAFREHCPVKRAYGKYVLRHAPPAWRGASRRAEQRTEAFAENYRIRSGAESVNSGLKRRTGMGRLRVRGLARMSMAVLLRCAGWNLMRSIAGGLEAILTILASVAHLFTAPKPQTPSYAT
jgi:hypothetical protein